MPVASDLERSNAELDVLDRLERPRRRAPIMRRIWSSAWPKLLAIVIAVGLWQIVVLSGWRDETILPSPFTVFATFWDERAALWEATLITLQRAFKGYALALLIGGVIGLAVSRSRILRAAVGSMITGLQTMPSIAWFPAAIAIFKLSETAILFVVILGAAPSIANGIIHGVDHIPPVLLRAGRVLGARRLTLMRHVVIPAALPSFVAGLKQGWAFAWRSLLAGELLVQLGEVALGQQLDFARQFSQYDSMYAVMLTILIIGIVIDAVMFGSAERWIRRRYGLVDASDS
jgi:NitT/TauT family transport system permease protein